MVLPPQSILQMSLTVLWMIWVKNFNLGTSRILVNLMTYLLVELWMHLKNLSPDNRFPNKSKTIKYKDSGMHKN